MVIKYLDVLDDGLFIWTGNYHTKDIAKTGGMSWSMSKKRWETAMYDVAKKLSYYATDKALKRLADMEEHQQVQKKLSSAANPDNVDKDLIKQIPAPPGYVYYPFQIVGVNFALNAKHVLFADEMGLGKTIQAIGVMNCLSPQKTLVVCPATLTFNWKKAITEWSVNTLKIKILSPRLCSKVDADVYIISYDLLSAKKVSWLSEMGFDILIGDEAHYLKRGSTIRSKAFKKMKKRSKKVLLLTGTPIVNRPSELYNLLTILDFKISYHEYINRYCAAFDNGFGMDYKGASNLEELQYKLRCSVMVRREKADVLTELPDKIREVVYCDPSKYAKIISKETKVMSKYVADALDYDTVMSQLSTMGYDDVVEITAVRKELAIEKIPDAIAEIDAILDSVSKIAVFAHHREVVDTLYNHYRGRAVKLYGGMSGEQKDEAVTQFQTNPDIQIFIGSNQAAGVGITLTAANIMLVLEMDWTPGVMQQIEDRLHRIGQKMTVVIKYLVVDGTIDAMLAQTLSKKREVIQAVTSVKAIENFTAPEVSVIKPLSIDFNTDGIRIYSYPEKILLKQTLVKLYEQLPDGTDLDKSVFDVFSAAVFDDTLTDAECHRAEKIIEVLIEKLSMVAELKS